MQVDEKSDIYHVNAMDVDELRKSQRRFRNSNILECLIMLHKFFCHSLIKVFKFKMGCNKISKFKIKIGTCVVVNILVS